MERTVYGICIRNIDQLIDEEIDEPLADEDTTNDEMDEIVLMIWIMNHQKIENHTNVNIQRESHNNKEDEDEDEKIENDDNIYNVAHSQHVQGFLIWCEVGMD